MKEHIYDKLRNESMQKCIMMCYYLLMETFFTIFSLLSYSRSGASIFCVEIQEFFQETEVNGQSPESKF